MGCECSVTCVTWEGNAGILWDSTVNRSEFSFCFLRGGLAVNNALWFGSYTGVWKGLGCPNTGQAAGGPKDNSMAQTDSCARGCSEVEANRGLATSRCRAGDGDGK